MWFEELGIKNPYHSDKSVCIIKGDSCEILPQIKDGIAQMIFADPNFNMNKKHPTHKDKRTDYYQWCDEWIDDCFTKLNNTGTFYLMTIVRHLEKLYPMLGNKGFFINEIHWRNVSASHSKRSFWNTYQPILLYGKTEGYLFNTYAQTRKNMERWTEFKTGAKGQMMDYWDDIPFVYAGSIRHKEAIIKPLTNKKIHPCQMPLELARRCIMFSTNPGDIIIDPFTGTGTVPFAAKELGRKCIAVDLEESYCEISAKRCSQEILIST